MPRVNADEILREIGDWRNMGDVVAAGKIAVRKLSQYFDEEITFNQESRAHSNGNCYRFSRYSLLIPGDRKGTGKP